MFQIKQIISYHKDSGDIISRSLFEVVDGEYDVSWFKVEDGEEKLILDEPLSENYERVALPLTDPPEFLIREPIKPDNLADLRVERDILLKESDWTQLPDSPLSSEKKAEWAAYRQALRDLPINADTSLQYKDIEFPTPPA